MDMSEMERAPVRNIQMSSEHQHLSETLYYVLAMVLKGRALRMLMSVGQGEGIEAWRVLVRHYEPEAGGRLLGFLASVLNPDLGGSLPPNQVPERFPDLLTAWQNSLEQYHRTAPQRINDEILTAALISKAPAMVRDYLVLNSGVLGTKLLPEQTGGIAVFVGQEDMGL